MRRLFLLGALAVAVLAFASQAMANTTVPVSMTFTEPIVPAFKSGDCPVVPEGFCGSGAGDSARPRDRDDRVRRGVRRGVRSTHDQPRGRLDHQRGDVQRPELSWRLPAQLCRA